MCLAVIRRIGPGRWNRVALAVVLWVLALLFHVVRYDASLAKYAACRRLYKHEQWDALLEEAKDNPSGDPRLQFMTNFALSQKRRLLDEMFNYPQVWGTRGLVFNFFEVGVSPAEDDSYRAMYNSDLFFEMGHVNASFRHVYNTMWAGERTYEVLQRMAACSMVNGNYAMAAKYLNLLQRTLFHRDFARRYQAIIADPEVAQKEFADRRKRLPVVESRMRSHPLMPFLQLLQTRPYNPMAFDYLTAWDLFDKESIGMMPVDIGRFRSAGYTSLPTHCQEALLILEKQRGARIDLQGFSYDETTRARVEAFFQDRAHKAFVLPQEDPAYYDTFIDTYNVVELVKSRVDINTFRLAQGMQQPAVDAEFPNPPQVDAYTGPTRTIAAEGPIPMDGYDAVIEVDRDP